MRTGSGVRKIGFIVYDPQKRSAYADLNQLMHFLSVSLNDGMGPDRKETSCYLEFHPVWGVEGRIWVLFAAEERSPHRFSENAWCGRFRRPVGVVAFMDGGRSFGRFHRVFLDPPDSPGMRVRGVFRYRMGVPMPGMSILIPGRWVQPGPIWDVEPSAAANEDFQGFWMDGHHLHPVWRFMAFPPDSAAIPLHPEGGDVGFLAWGDGRSRLAIWLMGGNPDGTGARMDIVDVQRQKVLRRFDELADVPITLPDGRWALRRNPTGETSELVVGMGDEFRNLGSAHGMGKLLLAIPITATEWVIVDGGGVTLMEGLMPVFRDEAPIQEIISLSLAARTSGGCLDPRIRRWAEEDSAVAEFFSRPLPVTHDDFLVRRGRLGVVCYFHSGKILFLPSFRLTDVRVPLYIGYPLILVGENGFLIGDTEGVPHRSTHRLRFFGSDGSLIHTARLLEFQLKDILLGRSLGGIYLLGIAVQGSASPSARLITIDEQGNPRDDVLIRIPPSALPTIRIVRDLGDGVILEGSVNDRRKIHIIVSRSGKISFTVTL